MFRVEIFIIPKWNVFDLKKFHSDIMDFQLQ